MDGSVTRGRQQIQRQMQRQRQSRRHILARSNEAEELGRHKEMDEGVTWRRQQRALEALTAAVLRTILPSGILELWEPGCATEDIKVRCLSWWEAESEYWGSQKVPRYVLKVIFKEARVCEGGGGLGGKSNAEWQSSNQAWYSQDEYNNIYQFQFQTFVVVMYCINFILSIPVCRNMAILFILYLDILT